MPSRVLTTVPLESCREPLGQALHWLTNASADIRPFVVLEQTRRPARFVQFAGSKSEPLVIDCPPLGVRGERVTMDAAFDEVVAALSRQGCTPETPIVITLGQSAPPGGGIGELAFGAA